ERQNNSTSQTTFASKEATSLASGSPVDAGTYAPRLNIEALWNWEADFNDDNVVDALDLQFWKNSYGVAADARKLQGDADGDGDVDGSDFMLWQRQFTAGGMAAENIAIPEPSSACLVVLVIATYAVRARTRIA